MCLRNSIPLNTISDIIYSANVFFFIIYSANFSTFGMLQPACETDLTGIIQYVINLIVLACVQLKLHTTNTPVPGRSQGSLDNIPN